MSIQHLGGLEEFDDVVSTSSWERARDQQTEVSRVGRAEWMVCVGDGDRHRVLFALEGGQLVGECDCRGYTHHERCAHLAALLRAYVTDEVVPVDLETPIDEEVDALWASRPDGGDDRPHDGLGGGRQ